MNTSSQHASLLPLFAFLSACAASVNAPLEPSAVMLGAWSYATPHVAGAEPSLNAGLHVQMAIDSLEGMRFWGRVTLWFAGDVGIPPTAFGRVSGTVDGGNGVTLVIPRQPTNARPLMVTGDLAGDVLTVLECHAGTEPGPFVARTAFLRIKAGDTATEP